MKKILLALAPVCGTTSLFAQDVATTATKQQNLMQTVMMVGIAIVFFYFILFRPEQKRRKKMEAQRATLQKGDKVTAMGIVGTVQSIKEKTVILNMVDGTKVEFLKAAITEVYPSTKEEDEAEVITES